MLNYSKSISLLRKMLIKSHSYSNTTTIEYNTDIGHDNIDIDIAINIDIDIVDIVIVIVIIVLIISRLAIEASIL